MQVILPAHLEGDLEWTEATKEACLAVEKGKKIFWKFDFGWERGSTLSLDDPLSFHAFGIAIDHFLKELLPLFKENTLGVCFYRGDLECADKFLWSAELQERQKEQGEAFDLFAVRALAEYMHRLGAPLPEEVPLYCVVDALKNAKSAQRASKEHFEHIRIATYGQNFPFGGWVVQEEEMVPREEAVGVCMPLHEHCSEGVLYQLNLLFADLEKEGTPFRVVHEACLTEEWLGLEKLHVIFSAVSAMGKRKLQGFSAAGGEIFLR